MKNDQGFLYHVLSTSRADFPMGLCPLSNAELWPWLGHFHQYIPANQGFAENASKTVR